MNRLCCAMLLLAWLSTGVCDISPDAAANSAGGEWSIDWYSMDAGGTLEASGGNWQLAGTIGQADASAANALSGGNQWQLTGGFWALLAESLDRLFSDRFQDDSALAGGNGHE